MIVKIKKTHPNAVIPKYALHGDAGMDIVAVTKNVDEYGNISYGTGLAFEIPDGFFMMLVPRSSNHKTNLILTNHLGVVDSGFRGEVSFKYAAYERKSVYHYDYCPAGERDTEPIQYNVGDRIGQLIIMPYPVIEFEQVSELSESVRGISGYGSTGN